MPTALAVAFAGALGALARWGLDSYLARRSGDFPWGIFAVNVSGAFLLGVAVELMRGSLETATWFRTGITVGLLGAYTTFSTLSLDSYRLLEEGEIGFALLNTVGTLAAGLLAIWLGILAGDALS